MITRMDRDIGRLMELLKAKSVDDNTIVFFTSDNGGERYSNMAGLARGKGEVWEGGIRVPSVIQWPAMVKAPLRSDIRCSGMDVFPTILDILGKPLPADRTYDGVSILPVLRGEAQDLDARPLAFANGNQRAWMEGRYKIVTGVKKENKHFNQLYDMEEDPYERVNLIHSMPEVFTRLFKNYQAWEKDALRDASDGVSEITDNASATADIQ